MRNTNRNPAPRSTNQFTLWMVLSLLLSAGGCAGISQGHSDLHKGDQGTVALEEVVDWSFEASHPITIDQDTVKRILHGVRIGTGQGSPAFTDHDTEFLSPLISTALTQASPEQVVVFQVLSETGSVPEATGGTIYAKGPSVYVTLTQFRSHPIRTGFWSWASVRPSPPHELAAGMLSFVPESAARTQRATSEVAMNYANLSTLVIDHLVLARLAEQERMAATVKSPTIPTDTADSSHRPLLQPQQGTTILVPAKTPAHNQESAGYRSQDRPSFSPAAPGPSVAPSTGSAKTPASSQPARDVPAKPSKTVKSKKSTKTAPQANVKKAPQPEMR